MNDDVKKALEMVPHGHKADHAQLWAHLKALAAHLDAEPARQAAAIAAAREEQREVDARALLALVADPECSCAQQEDVCFSCEVDGYARAIRATPLTATPLKDRIAELEGEERRANALEYARDAELHRALAAEAERDALANSLACAAGASVEQAKALHEKLAVGIMTERDAMHARLEETHAELERARGIIGKHVEACPSPDEGERVHVGGSIVWCHDSEVSHLRAKLAETTERLFECSEANRALRAQLAEAVETLRRAQEFLEAEGFRVGDDVQVDGAFELERMARAFLAKHPEGT